ncbi:MAG: hypothetical protein QNJ53_17780 [Pleurocapsa sp. MO_192.B19]|nr:hypothetical protein [Pleurocapsa sp. MO_192.B19]
MLVLTAEGGQPQAPHFLRVPWVRQPSQKDLLRNRQGRSSFARRGTVDQSMSDKESSIAGKIDR